MSKAFGDHLRKLRKEKSNYSQQNMADMLKISRSTYTYYETGKSEPGQAVLRQLCEILSVDYNTLLTLSMFKPKVANSTTVTVSLDEYEVLQSYKNLSDDNKALLRTELDKLK